MSRQAVAILIAVGTLALGAPQSKDIKEVVYYPPEATELLYTVSEGEMTLGVTKVENTTDGKVVHFSRVQAGGNKSPHQVILSNKVGMFALEELGEKYDPRHCVFEYGAKAGDSWNIETERADVGKISATFKVGPSEKQKVPAGEFESIRVDMSAKVGGVPMNLTFWYAASVGVVNVQERAKTIQELKSIKLAPKK